MKHLNIIIALHLVLLTACSKEDKIDTSTEADDTEIIEDSGGQTGDTSDTQDSEMSSALDYCYFSCEYMSEGEGCVQQAVEDECKSQCDSNISTIPSQCEELYSTWVICSENENYVCDGSNTTNGVNWPYTEDTLCSDDFESYATCYWDQ
jgi:hypothetical protein